MRSLLIGAMAALGLGAAAAAQPTITWFTVDGGGGASSGGGFTLTGTIGQCDASPPLTGADFTLIGGFWPGVGGCRADWNGDGFVNSSDISGFLTSWLASVTTPDLVADFNEDGTTNSSDISAFLTAWLDAVTGGC